MSDDPRAGDDAGTDRTRGGDAESPTRRAVLTTTHADAAVVAASLAPDNTESMTTTVRESTVETTIERDRTGGLQSSVDDYVVNLSVADAVCETARDTRPNHE